MSQKEQSVVGILCDGQLAMMTGEAANKHGIIAIALGLNSNSPASHAIETVEGDFNDYENVVRFADKVESLVLDTDHVKTDALFDLRDDGKLIVPHPSVITGIQNRIILKTLLEEHNISTAPFHAAFSSEEVKEAFLDLDKDVIIKTATEGFDGRGNTPMSDEKELSEFLSENTIPETGYIIEKRLELDKELAMMIARDTHNNTVFYPMVESFHTDGMLEHTFYPTNVNEEIEIEARRLGQLVTECFSGPLLLGIEMMLTTSGELVVNEAAGRPHNTGHFSIEAVSASQFENLVFIASGQEVISPVLVHPEKTVLMRNLNGGTKQDMTPEDFATLKSFDGYLHWYHKDPRPRRKRGHMTIFGDSREETWEKSERAINAIGFNG